MSTNKILCRNDESFAAHTPLRVGGNAQQWIWVYSEQELQSVMTTMTKKRWMIHWPFQDVLCREGGYHGTVIRLAGDFSKIEYTSDSITLGSAALWAQVVGPFQKSFEDWSGSVGDLFTQKKQHILKGYTLTLRWFVGKKIVEEVIEGHIPSKYQKRGILLSLCLTGKPRKRKNKPIKSGEIYTIRSKDDIANIFEQYELSGIRLKGWLLSKKQPSRILRIGAGTMDELLILGRGIKERVYKVSGKRIDIRTPIIGKEKKHVE